jgi:hypothetical protein
MLLTNHILIVMLINHIDFSLGTINNAFTVVVSSYSPKRNHIPKNIGFILMQQVSETQFPTLEGCAASSFRSKILWVNGKFCRFASCP